MGSACGTPVVDEVQGAAACLHDWAGLTGADVVALARCRRSGVTS